MLLIQIHQPFTFWQSSSPPGLSLCPSRSLAVFLWYVCVCIYVYIYIYIYIYIGEGNGNPLQYSCLENPMDGEAWCRLLSMGSQRVGQDWATSLHSLIYIYVYVFHLLNLPKLSLRHHEISPCLPHHSSFRNKNLLAPKHNFKKPNVTMINQYFPHCLKNDLRAIWLLLIQKPTKLHSLQLAVICLQSP